jgi:hypothetical protein
MAVFNVLNFQLFEYDRVNYAESFFLLCFVPFVNLEEEGFLHNDSFNGVTLLSFLYNTLHTMPRQKIHIG